MHLGWNNWSSTYTVKMAEEVAETGTLKAVVAGATGATGKRLLVELIKAKVRVEHLLLAWVHCFIVGLEQW